MEVVEGDFDDSAFPEFLAGFAREIDTEEACELPPSPPFDSQGE